MFCLYRSWSWEEVKQEGAEEVSMELDSNVPFFFDYDECTYQDFIIKVDQDAPWNKPYIVGYWEEQVPSDADLEDYHSDINNIVETIARFKTVFGDTNQTDKWSNLTKNIREHAVKFEEYRSK